MEINALDIVIHIINIFVLFLILRLFVYKPVSNFMNARKARIAEELANSEKTEEEAIALKNEYAVKLADSEKSANEQMVKVVAGANEEAERITALARDEAVKITEEAHKKAEADAAAVMSGMKDDIKSLSISIASKILDREVSEEDNKALVDSVFEEVQKQ